MLIELPSGTRVHHTGDPHLGRRFETGVPHERRGEREAQQLIKFKLELDTDCDVNITMGDLFDHPQVALSVIIDAADAYLKAADRNPNTQFFVMAGNHDRSRNLGAIGGWEIFKRLIEDRRKNLFVVDTAGQVETIAFFPWEWGVSAVDQVRNSDMDPSEINLIVGHWDLQSFGGNDDHLCPAKLLNEMFPQNNHIVSGHYHIEGTWPVGDHWVRCTGSLEPYSHGEDPEGEIYVTLSSAELAEIDPDILRDKCVRVLLREGEELPVGLDCLALTGKRITDQDDEESVAEKLGAFDWSAILDECLADVPTYVREFIDERLHPVN